MFSPPFCCTIFPRNCMKKPKTNNIFSQGVRFLKQTRFALSFGEASTLKTFFFFCSLPHEAFLCKIIICSKNCLSYFPFLFLYVLHTLTLRVPPCEAALCVFRNSAPNARCEGSGADGPLLFSLSATPVSPPRAQNHPLSKSCPLGRAKRAEQRFSAGRLMGSGPEFIILMISHRSNSAECGKIIMLCVNTLFKFRKLMPSFFFLTAFMNTECCKLSTKCKSGFLFWWEISLFLYITAAILDLGS